MELTETTRVKDGYIWRCMNKRCRTWLSIRSGSFFQGSNIISSSWLHLMFLWAIQISGSRIARLTSLSKATVVRALDELRTICSNKVLNAGIKIGGLGKTVEIDESKFGAKRKYKRGRVSEGPWVFGSQKVLLFCVPDRTRETLVHCLITTHIQPGTVIYSDQFTSYIPLNQLGYIHVCTPVFSIPQTCQLSVLGLILQDNGRFDCHVHVKLIKANKCLFILRSLRKEGYSQAELDHLFSSIVLPSITYGLPVYGASEAELTTMQCFLDRCYKRKYTSKSFSIKHLLEEQDRKVFRKVSGIDRHPLRRLLPKKKASTYNLRNRTSQYPKVNTDRSKNSYINRIIFKYNLAM
ncbi:uncharacterized protein [Acropora muricata]|uniref:uncharacterized protein n=1 Tax=Acropora muricata TaxID=159855 RepID=UPI0034E37D2D